MDYVTCTITQGGDSRSQVCLPERSAIPYAEVYVLRTVHGGQETVRDIRVIDQREVNNSHVKQDMRYKYGEVVDHLYPGLMPVLPELADDDPFLLETAPKKPRRKLTRKRAADPAPFDPPEDSTPDS